jgi:hypothetical protein
MVIEKVPLIYRHPESFKEAPGEKRERDGEGKRAKVKHRANTVKHRANTMRDVLTQPNGKFAEARDLFRLPGFVLEFIQIAFCEVRKRD